MSKVFVIAEMASTHTGRFSWIQDGIQIARDCGANAFKLQWTSNVARMCQRRNAPDYHSAYGLINFPPNWLEGIARETERRGLEFLCTVFLEEDIKTVAPYISAFKISSFEAQDSNFIDAVQNYSIQQCGNKHTYISCGMFDAEQLEQLHGGQGNFSILQCTSSYPAPLEDMNLGMIQQWPKVVGLSDHSRCEDMGMLAVAAGATVIETHFCHPWCPKSNKDFATSFFPNKFGNYIEKVRRAEKIYGTGEKVIQPSEEAMLRYRVKGD